MQIIAASRDDFARDKVENSFPQIQVGQYKRRKISCEEYKNKVAIDNSCVGRVKALSCILVLLLAVLCLVIFKTPHLHNVIEMNASIKASLELLAKHRIGTSALMRCNCVNEVFIFTQLFDRMCMALGGRAAEAKIFKRVTTGMFSRVFSFRISLPKFADVFLSVLSSIKLAAFVRHVSYARVLWSLKLAKKKTIL